MDDAVETNFLLVRESDETDQVLFATATCFDPEGLSKWVLYLGDDGAGGSDLGHLKFIYDDVDFDIRHIYLCIDIDGEFIKDLLTGEDVSVPLDDRDREIFVQLGSSVDAYLGFDEDDNCFAFNEDGLNLLIDEGDDGVAYSSSDFDWEFLEEITSNTPLKYKYFLD